MDSSLKNVHKAVELSQTKYCGVSATLKDGHEVVGKSNTYRPLHRLRINVM